MGIRGWVLRGFLLLGLVLVVTTEALGSVAQIRAAPLAIAWMFTVGLAAVYTVRMRPTMPRWRFDPVVALCALAVVAILALTGVAAVFSPPNSADAMAYHLPRVVYWAQQASVRPFPTPYFNQITLQPLAEYAMLHGYLLSGGDRLVNLIQWIASAVSIVAASAVSAEFGAGPRGQALAALFCATIPAGVLASSGAKNDYLLSAALLSAVYFGMRFAKSARIPDAAFLGIAVGLSLLTKATAYLFLPWVLAAVLITRLGVRTFQGLLIAGSLALAINAPHYVRNFDLSGSIFGFDSAQGDGVFRWRNESLGWRPAVSNLLRHTSEQLGARSERWNRGVFDAVVGAHERLGIDPNDPATTWHEAKFTPPRNANHEADAPNRLHLLVLILAALNIVWRAARGGERGRALYVMGLVLGLVAYCAYLKWQPFMARLVLPLFVLGSPLVAVFGDLRGPRGLVVSLALGWLFLDAARHPALDNWVRPLRGPRSVFTVSREYQYFSDMAQWKNASAYWRTVELVSASGCRTVGIDAHNLQLEYPLQALLLARDPSVRFLHTAVVNVSARFAQPTSGEPCAVVCLDCQGDTSRLARYADFPVREIAGKFVVLVRR